MIYLQSSKVLELSSELDSKTEEIRHLSETVDRLKTVNQKHETSLENHIQKLKEVWTIMNNI